MDIPAVPDPAQQPAKFDRPAEPPCAVPLLAGITGGAETNADRGKVRAVPELADDDRGANR